MYHSSDGFTGDVYLLVKLLLPGAGKKRVYNLQSKQIVKILAQVQSNCVYMHTYVWLLIIFIVYCITTDLSL